LRYRRLKVTQGWAYASYSKVQGMHGKTFEMTHQVTYQKLFQIQSPTMSSTFVEESDPRDDNKGTWIMDQTGWIDPFAIFHGAVSTISFADGHAEGHTWKDPKTIAAATAAAAGNASQSFVWPGGDKSNRDFVWMWDRYRFQNWRPLP